MTDRNSVNQLRHIDITALNSDGAEVSISGELEVSLLKGPSGNKRERLWIIPDILTITESEYLSRFPDYYIPGKEQMSKWEIEKSVGKRNLTVVGNDSIDISGLISQPSYYRFTWKWKDARGKVLEIIQYAMIYDDAKLLPGNETIQVSYQDKKYEPGEIVDVDMLTGLPSAPKSIRVVERRIDPVTKAWFPLPTYNDKSIKITEADRGGIYMHFMTAYNNRFHQSQHLIQVPWSNKDLNVKLTTWRDKLEPGDEETWTMTVKGSKMMQSQQKCY